MKPWEKFGGRGKCSRFFTRDKDEAALRGFAEDVGRALQTFQVSSPSSPVAIFRSRTMLRLQEL